MSRLSSAGVGKSSGGRLFVLAQRRRGRGGERVVAAEMLRGELTGAFLAIACRIARR